MRSTLIAALAASTVTAGAFLLNPDIDRHRQEIDQSVTVRSPLAGAIGLGVLRGLTIDYHSIGIASWTADSRRTVSVGALGMVWVLEAD